MKKEALDASEDAQLRKLRATISKQLAQAAKRTVHSERNKPLTTVEVPATPALASLLFNGPTRNTDVVAKRHFPSAAFLLEWLPELPKTLHPVSNKVSSWGGGKVYVWAGWASAEATFVKGKQLIKLKVKTQMVGSGRPQAIRGGEAAYDG